MSIKLPMTVYLSKADREILESLSKVEKLSKSDVMRYALRQYGKCNKPSQDSGHSCALMGGSS
jgi:hypothetical protein